MSVSDMRMAELIFWFSALCVAYATAGYPLLLWAITAIVRRGPRRTCAAPRSISIVMAAHNEEARVRDRVLELQERLEASGLDGEIIVVSDGSSDATVALARIHEGERVRVIALPVRVGKAAALNAGWAAATGEVLVFVDARQSLAPTALRRLIEPFSDPGVGAVSGELVLESSPGILGGVGWYWRCETWLRRLESRAYSAVGVTGAISAVRRGLFRPIPKGTVLDDVYWPLVVVMRGHRVVHAPAARAYDRLPARVEHEFRRKVRTLAGNYQLLWRLPSALLPWRNPAWLQFLSHKVLRLLTPWALLAMALTSAVLEHSFYRFSFFAQAAFYGAAAVGLWRGSASRSRLLSAAASFVLLNAAAWAAFWVWITGNAARVWGTGSWPRRPSSDQPLGAPEA